MDRFIAQENIRHFSDRLRYEVDLDKRSSLQKLLVDEEDKLGSDLELIAEVDRFIASFESLIQTQSALVAALERDGDDRAPPARSLLDGLAQSQTLYKEYRHKIVHAVRIAR